MKKYFTKHINLFMMLAALMCLFCALGGAAFAALSIANKDKPKDQEGKN